MMTMTAMVMAMMAMMMTMVAIMMAMMTHLGNDGKHRIAFKWKC